MGVVTARSAGVLDVAVCAPPGPGGDIDPVILGTCRLCGVERVYRMGGAQAIAALAYGTETVDAVDVIVGPGNLYVQEAKHQLSAHRRDRRLRRAQRPARRARRRRREREIELAALDMLAQAEHGAGSAVLAACAGPELAAALEQRAARADGAGSEAVGRRADRNRRVRVATRGARARERVRARAPGADRRRGGGARAAGHQRRLPVRRRGQRDGLRRLRRRLKPRAADGRRGALRLDALPAHFRRRMNEVHDRPGGRETGRGRRADRARRGIRPARRVDARPSAGE